MGIKRSEDSLMLRKQHQFAARIHQPEQRQDYRLHMCGVCHALGDSYGQWTRLLTNQEIILLNLLVDAQLAESPSVVMRRCPLNPTRHVRTNQNIASEFAASIAIGLSKASVEDDLQDGNHFAAPLTNWLLSKPYQHALQSLATLDFDAETLRHLTQSQTSAENNGDEVAPSALLSAQIFAQTALLANQPENVDILARMGAQYGSFLYLLDAYVDFAEDIAHETFNPLRRFTNLQDGTYSLTVEGLRWLRQRMAVIQEALEADLANLTLYRYGATLREMLITPIVKACQDLDQRINTLPAMRIQRWTWKDALKAAVFAIPPMVVLTASYELPPSIEEEMQGNKRKRRSNNNNNCDDGNNCDTPYFTGFGLGLDSCDCMACMGDAACDSCTNTSTCDVGDCNGCSNLDIGGCDNLDCGGADCST
jgi:hypothetical protein